VALLIWAGYLEETVTSRPDALSDAHSDAVDVLVLLHNSRALIPGFSEES